MVLRSKLHLIIVNDSAHITGGAAQVALTSAVGLAELGYDVTVFSAVEPVMPELKNKKIKLICTQQHDILNDPNRFRAACQGLWNRRAERRMETLLDQLDPTRAIVHLHGWTMSLSCSIVRPAIRRHFPVVVTLHEYFTACPNGTFLNYRKERVCHLTPLSFRCVATNCDKNSYAHKLWRVFRQVIQKKWGHLPDGIDHYICVSSFSKNILMPFLPPHANIYEVPNPIHVDKADPAAPQRSDQFVSIGRLSPEKGPFLFAAAARMINSNPVFIGDGQCRNTLQNKYPEAIITGWLNREEVKKRLYSARALVLPSLWYETQGLVVLEAAALGIPAIVPDNSAARDIVADGETGFWFITGDEGNLAMKMQMLADDELVRRMGRAAYDRFWSDPPTLEKHIQRLEDVYQRMLRIAKRSH